MTRTLLARLRPMLLTVGCIAFTGGLLWALLNLPSDAWYAAHAQTLADLAEPLVWVGAVAQTAYVLLWMTLPWWRRSITRSIMVKSVGLALLLDLSVVNAHVPSYAAATAVALLVIGVVVAGSVSQFLALAWAMWRARREDRLPLVDPRP